MSNGPHMQISVFTSDSPLSKTFRRGPGGVEKIPGGKLTRGFVERKSFLDLEDFSQFISGLNGVNALAYGIPKHDHARVLSQRELESEKGGDLPVITRTRSEFAWPAGEGVMMLDHDVRKDRDEPLTPDQLLNSIISICPDLVDAPMLLTHSASSYIYDGDTLVSGPKGMRIYIHVKDARDIPRAGNALFKRLWLSGRGYVEIGQNGRMQNKTLIDASVWRPEGLDFAGGAHCEPPVRQDRPGHLLMNADFEAEPFDTTLIKDLSEDEERRYQELVKDVRKLMEQEASRRRAEWLLSLPEDQRAAAETATLAGILPADFVLTSVDGEEFTVREALADKERYHGTYVRHPFEPDYQDNEKLAQLKLDHNPKPCVHTFAHGNETFWLDTAEVAFADIELPRELGPVRASTLSIMDTPPREWLLGKRYISKFVTATVSPGGGSKSTLIMQEALSIATGKNICGEEIKVVAPVWISNNEDPIDEVQRRLAAICMHHKLDPVEDTKNVFLSGKELQEDMRVKLGLEHFSLRFAEPGEGGKFVENKMAISFYERFIRENGIKLWVLDPFVSCHGFPEGDNTNVDRVMKIITGICDRTNSACSAAGHTPKGVNVSGNADAWRGGGAMRDAARIMDTFAVMDEKECEKYGISKTMRSWYVKRESAKANMRPPGEDLKWFKRVSVLLLNGKDNVGVLEPIELDQVETIPAEDTFLSQVVFSMMNDGDTKTVNSISKTIIDERGEELGKLMGSVPSKGFLNDKIEKLFATPQRDEENMEIRFVNKRLGTSKASKYLTAKLIENEG